MQKSLLQLKMESNQDKEYYIATTDEKGEMIVYNSVAYKLSEIDLINLIKICLKEERNKGLGRKLLDAYKDSTLHRPQITNRRLSLIGIEEKPKEQPETIKKPKLR